MHCPKPSNPPSRIAYVCGGVGVQCLTLILIPPSGPMPHRPEDFFAWEGDGVSSP